MSTDSCKQKLSNVHAPQQEYDVQSLKFSKAVR